MIYIGIDPGLAGGIALYGGEGFVLASTMPIIKSDSKKILALNDIVRMLKDYQSHSNMTAIIEKVGAMPGQGVTSTFTFGQGYGALKGILAALEIPFEEVTPQKWQKAILNGIPVDLKKQRSVAFCASRFPKLPKLKDGPADALCLALYGYQRGAE